MNWSKLFNACFLPIEAVDVIDHVFSTLPNELSGLWPSWLVYTTSKSDGLAFEDLFGIFTDEGSSRRIWKIL